MNENLVKIERVLHALDKKYISINEAIDLIRKEIETANKELPDEENPAEP